MTATMGASTWQHDSSRALLGPRLAASLLVILLGTATIWPRERAVFGVSAASAEIARGAPSVSPYALAVALALLLVLPDLVRRWQRYAPWALFGFAVTLTYLAVLVWPHDSVRVSGTLHWLTAVCAWVCAARLVAAAVTDRGAVRILLLGLLAIAVVEAGVCTAQRIGFSINPMDPETQLLMGARTNGTMPHPGNEGKNFVLLLAIMFPFLTLPDRGLKRIAGAAALVSLVPLVLSGGRANILAVIVMALFWVALIPRGKERRARRWRWIVPTVLALALIPAAGPIVDRWEADPTGGERPHLIEVGFSQIADSPVSGTGPNAYVSVVGAYDSVTASGNYPVHNVVLLTIAELGILVSGLLWLSVGTLALVAVRARKRLDFVGDFARATISLLAGLVVVGQTGWGLASLSVLILWFLVMGVLYGVLRNGDRSSDYWHGAGR